MGTLTACLPGQTTSSSAVGHPARATLAGWLGPPWVWGNPWWGQPLWGQAWREATRGGTATRERATLVGQPGALAGATLAGGKPGGDRDGTTLIGATLQSNLGGNPGGGGNLPGATPKQRRKEGGRTGGPKLGCEKVAGAALHQN